MSKRTSFTSITGKPTADTTKPSTPPVSALLHTITGNPDNPRDEGELDLEELIESFREVGQLQPVLAVSREVYLKHKPAHTETIGDAEYVTIGGNRRLQAARALGWVRIDIALRDDLGEGEGSLDEAVIIENIHRKNLTPIREAGFLKGMVDRYGSQGKVATRIGKTQAYVSQRLALLKLEPELQEAVESGELKVKEARKIAAAPATRQRQVWEDAKAAPADVSPPRADSAHNPVMGSSLAADGQLAKTEVGPKLVEEPAGESDRRSLSQAVPTQQRSSETAVGESRDSSAAKPVLRMPWTEGSDCAVIAVGRMTMEEALNMVEGIVIHYGAPAVPRVRSVLERLEKEQDAAAGA